MDLKTSLISITIENYKTNVFPHIQFIIKRKRKKTNCSCTKSFYSLNKSSV